MESKDYEEAIQYVVDVVAFADGYGGGDTTVKLDKEGYIASAISEAMQTKYFKAWLGGFMCYNGRRWIKVDGADDMPKIVYEIVRLKNVGIVYQMPNTIGKIVKKICGNIHIKTYTGNKRYVAFRNCVLDMVTKKQLGFSEEYESMIYLDFDYNPKADCPDWDKTVKQIISDDASISVLYEFLGLVFVDRTKLNVETALFFVGTGSNGKGVISDMVSNILGDNQVSVEFSLLCTHNNAEYYRASVAGKLLNFCYDMGVKEFSNGIFKTLTSREPIMCRFPSGRPFMTRDMPLMGASINKMPIVTDSSDGFWRRCKFILFSKTFSDKDQDKTLKFRLRSEASGVFNKILSGMDRIMSQNGDFTESLAMKEHSINARIDSNSVLSWCQENRYKGARHVHEMVAAGTLKANEYIEMRMFSADIMKSYVTYCTEQQQYPKSRPNLNEDLKSEGFVYKTNMRSGIGEDARVTSGFIFYKIIKSEVIDKIEQEKLIDELPF